MPYCTNCGEKTDEGLNFCSEYGTKISATPQPPIEKDRNQTRIIYKVTGFIITLCALVTSGGFLIKAITLPRITSNDVVALGVMGIAGLLMAGIGYWLYHKNTY